MEMQSFTCIGSFMGMGFWRGFVVVSWLWVCGYYGFPAWVCGGSVAMGLW